MTTATCINICSTHEPEQHLNSLKLDKESRNDLGRNSEQLESRKRRDQAHMGQIERGRLTAVAGCRDQLIETLQQQYGYERVDAEETS